MDDAGVDQVTTYTYGTTKGVSVGDSKVGTGHLLQKVQYPDSAGGTDVVTYAYNAQSQQIWTKDQAGNIIETDFDTGGRMTDKKITTLDGDFDGAVLRITTAYAADGNVDTITQYDAATAGNVVDQVQYSYDDWDNITKFAMDRNSVITGGTDASDGYYDVDDAYTKAAGGGGGRQALRLTSMTWPNGTSVTYEYLSILNLFDDDFSRVSRIKIGATAVALYAYTGVGQVVKTEYPQPDVMWEVHGSTTGSYQDLDRFGRITSSRWTKDLATDVDFYDVDLTYDRNSNITVIEDNIHVGFDVSYTNDNLNRLTKAEEGTWGGSSVSSRTREQSWTLDQLGNLEIGNLLDDDKNCENVYDPLGRLRKNNDTSDQSLVAEYW